MSDFTGLRGQKEGAESIVIGAAIGGKFSADSGAVGGQAEHWERRHPCLRRCVSNVMACVACRISDSYTWNEAERVDWERRHPCLR